MPVLLASAAAAASAAALGSSAVVKGVVVAAACAQREGGGGAGGTALAQRTACRAGSPTTACLPATVDRPCLCPPNTTPIPILTLILVVRVAPPLLLLLLLLLLFVAARCLRLGVPLALADGRPADAHISWTFREWKLHVVSSRHTTHTRYSAVLIFARSSTPSPKAYLIESSICSSKSSSSAMALSISCSFLREQHQQQTQLSNASLRPPRRLAYSLRFGTL